MLVGGGVEVFAAGTNNGEGAMVVVISANKVKINYL